MFPPSTSSSSIDEQEEPTLLDLLNQCATNLTEKAASNELATAYERDQEVEQILTSLASPLKGRIVITGGARVGKTATIHQVAMRLQQHQCPESLNGSELWGLSARSVLRAFGVHGWQEKLGELMEKWSERSDIILYIEALPATRFAGATADDPFDMAQFLLGQLQSSSNRILAEGRTSAVHSFLESYQEYKYILLEIKIAEAEIPIAQRMVECSCKDLEESQNIEIDQEAIDIAIDLTRRFSLYERLPGKAIDLISEGIALQSELEKENPHVTKDDIVSRFGEKTGLPRMILTDDEPYDEQTVRRHFSNRVLGQEQAVEVVVQALSLLRTRLNNPNRPMGVFLFMGPTGVGKTELARALSEFLFGSDEVIVRFNMADYTADWHVATLFGNPHGYDMESRRGQFTARLQDHAFAVILLDEFEKAHPEVFQRFLQLFDEGVLLNGASEMVNLRNSIVILTSNFGARVLSAGKLGFGPAISLEEQERQIREEMVRFFTPELINRIDSVSFFKPLTKSVLREIAYRRVQEILQREGLTRRNIDVEVDEDVIDWVVEYGYSERYGARYLARQIEKTITYPLAQQVIRNDPPDNSRLRLFIHRDRIASALELPPTQITDDETGKLLAPTSIPGISIEKLQADLEAYQKRVIALEANYDIEEARAQLANQVQDLAKPIFWDDPDNLQPNLVALEQLGDQVYLIDQLRRNVDELSEYLEKLHQTSDGLQHDLINEAVLRQRYLAHQLPKVESALTFHHPWHTTGAYIHIRAVGKRSVAAEWVTELARMYEQWATRRTVSDCTVISESLTSDGLTRELWLHIEGYGSYGMLRGETGMHRLVQYGTDGDKRQMVRAHVKVWPVLSALDIPKIDQNKLNVTSKNIASRGVFNETLISQVTASIDDLNITLTSPKRTNYVKDTAVKLIGIYQAVANSDDQDHISQSEDVRAYVRYKQQYVQDLRTEFQVEDVDAVMSGHIDGLLDSYRRSLMETRTSTSLSRSE